MGIIAANPNNPDSPRTGTPGAGQATSSGILHSFVSTNSVNISEVEREQIKSHPMRDGTVENFHNVIKEVFDKNPNASQSEIVAKIQALPMPPAIANTFTATNRANFGQDIFDIVKKDTNPYVALADNYGVQLQESSFEASDGLSALIVFLLGFGLGATGFIVASVKSRKIANRELISANSDYNEKFGSYSPQAILALQEAVRMKTVNNAKINEQVRHILDKEESARKQRLALEKEAERRRKLEQQAKESAEKLERLDREQEERIRREIAEKEAEMNRGILAGSVSDIQDVLVPRTSNIQDVLFKNSESEDNNKNNNVPGQAAWVVLE